MKRAFIIASFVGLFGSIFAIVIGYTDYGMLDNSIRDSLRPVWKWPILVMPFVLTSLSLLVPFAVHFFRSSTDPKMGITIYAFGYLWVPLLISYPGTKALGINSDSALVYTSFGVCVAQYFAAKIVLKAITSQAADSKI